MADKVQKVSYRYIHVSNRAGQGVKALEALADAGINLVACTGFPGSGGKAQLDFIAENAAGLGRVAKRQGWRMSPAKRAFVIQGQDRIGAVSRQLGKLARAGISITAADAVCAGAGRYGMLLWVKPKDYRKAALALGAR